MTKQIRMCIVVTTVLLVAAGRLAGQAPRPSCSAVLDVKVDELRAAYQKEFKKALNVNDRRQVSLAINRWLKANQLGAYTGIWNAEEGEDGGGSAVYGVAVINPDSERYVRVDDLKAAFKKQFKKALDINNLGQVSLAVNRWVAANKRAGYAGFWNGEERKDAAGTLEYGIVLTRPSGAVAIKVEELKAGFQKEFKSPLDVQNYRGVALAVNRWLGSHKLGGHAGFWNGEEGKDGAGNVTYGVVLFPLTDSWDLTYLPATTRRICQLTGDFDRATGKKTLNKTGERFGVDGTDLGSSFEHKGKLHFLFGDTWGRPGDRDVIAWTNSIDPYKITLEFPKADDGKWLPLTVPGIKQAEFEVPSYGISIADVIYVVCTTDHTEKKAMGRSVLASSSDDGRTFKRLYDLSRSKFINVSFWRADGWLFIYGSGEYRLSNVYLARVRPKDIAIKSKLEYFAGAGPGDEPRWSRKEADAAPLFKHRQVGEFSVSFVKPVNRYVMLYNSLKPRGIMMRTASSPWGPWSDTTTIFEPWIDNGYGRFMHIKGKNDGLNDPNQQNVWGGEYGPYIMSRYTIGANWSCRIFYTMSTWNPYQVVVMQTDLALTPPK